MAYSQKRIINAIQASRGLIAVAAKSLGCAPSTIYNAMKRYPAVADAVEAEREKTTDLAVTRLIEQMNDGNLQAIIFWLKTQGKRRGFVERTEIEHDVRQGGVLQVPMPMTLEEWTRAANEEARTSNESSEE